jgi:hypothetical protein
MPFQKIVSAFLLFSTLSGCVTYAPTLKPIETLKPTVGYIYARLTLHRESRFARGLRIGLILEEKETAETYTLQFQTSKKESGVSVIAVKPGIYKISKISFARGDFSALTTSVGEKPINDPRLTTEFRVEPGKAYYVGDFVGRTSADYYVVSMVQHWQMQSVANNYDNTTNELKEKFLNFKEIDTTSVIGMN